MFFSFSKAVSGLSRPGSLSLRHRIYHHGSRFPSVAWIHSRSFSEISWTKSVAEKAILLHAVAEADVTRLTRLFLDGVDANTSDHDGSTLLHIAARRGLLEMCELLVAHGAKINSIDRHGVTPLEAGLEHSTIVAFLKAKGGMLGEGRKSGVVKKLLQSAAKGDLLQLQRLVMAGADVNSGDYDSRTALHLAASEGKLACVEFLLGNGADPNMLDRFGNTALTDALRGSGAEYRGVVAALKQAGGGLAGLAGFAGAPLATSAKQSLPLLCERGAFAHVEAWLPSRGSVELTMAEWFTVPKHFDALSPFALSAHQVIGNSAESVWGQAWTSRQPVRVDVVTAKCLPNRFEQAAELGLTKFVLLPILDGQGQCAGLLACFPYGRLEGSFCGTESLQSFHAFACRLLAAGIFSDSRTPDFSAVPDVPPGQQAEVFKLLVGEGVFNANTVYNEVDWFYNMGLEKYYFQRFPSPVLAGHVHAFMAAKKFAATTGHTERVEIHLHGELLGVTAKRQSDHNDTFLSMVPFTNDKIVETEKMLERKVAAIPKEKACTLEFFLSERSPVPGGTQKLGIYVLQITDFVEPKLVGVDSESSLERVASTVFLRDKSPEAKARYQEVVSATVGELAPIVRVFPATQDGTIPVLLSFFATGAGRASYMPNLTELLDQYAITAKRKFIETFANGVVVYALYLNPMADITKVERMAQQYSTLHVIGESSLTPLFLAGDMDLEHYTYCSAVARFVYYFLAQRSEEWDALSRRFAEDHLNLGRLRLWHTSLKREAVQRLRIYEVMGSHKQLISMLYADFKQRMSKEWDTKGVPPRNDALDKAIRQEATSSLDLQVLVAMAQFNMACVKTNFYKPSKSALAFRLLPSFLDGYEWPTRPYAIFFIVGSSFQGFHVRFRDVARGGIRLIKSRDRSHYNFNLSTQFSENYGLAYTQNKKNKDIPEFGSKGTILLNEDSQLHGFQAFQKYVDGLLDVLCPSAEVVDNLGAPEILFLGPDEGTADMMAWAAKYARKRGYPYWRSVTTGKPAALGGIPHDRYGMTTRSVHRYVLGCLRKLGLQEEHVTKAQTGGPDGDLGSNEILLSSDRTTSIVDGSGVLHDPEGLDRAELTRLALARATVSAFDPAKLSKHGFRVLVSDSNVTLPSGEQVHSGLVFRNEFHLHPSSSAVLFVPCGGRPESVNLSNVRQLFDAQNKPRFRVIVEGANLFFTNDARMVLENAGVILYKDASTNKGGVTSSSLEVLAALALEESQFVEHMSVKEGQSVPSFYQRYVAQIQARIEADADLEFECIWNEHVLSGTHRYMLTDMVSDKINELNDFIASSSLWKDANLRDRVLSAAIPSVLQELAPLPQLHARVPEPYLRAIFSAYLASRYVYKYGVRATEFSFFEFMQPFTGKKPTKGSAGSPQLASASSPAPGRTASAP